MPSFWWKWRGQIEPAEVGGQVVLIPADAGENLFVSHWIPAGSAMDAVPGTAHMLEHIMFERCRTGRSTSPGGPVNAVTSNFWTRFDWRSAPGDIKPLLDSVSSVHDPLDVPPGLLERQREIIVQEIRERFALLPELQCLTEFDAELLQGTGLETFPTGSVDTVGQISAGDVATFHRLHYGRTSALTVIVGGPTASVAKRVALQALPGSSLLAVDEAGQANSLEMHVEDNSPSQTALTAKPALKARPPVKQTIVSDAVRRQRLFRRYVLAPAIGGLALPFTALLGAFLASRGRASLLAALEKVGADPAAVAVACQLTPAGLTVASIAAPIADGADADRIDDTIVSYFERLSASGIAPAELVRLKHRLAVEDEQLRPSQRAARLGEDAVFNGLKAALARNAATAMFEKSDFDAGLASFAAPLRNGARILRSKDASP